MKSKTRLDSAVFQLTPTRTRCDLVIIANGVSEKIATGLLDPFLAHLKTAQDQVAKGGYSITLEPKPGSDTAWFTKATIQRFVRFVNTPEVLERVNTIESEITQIEESIVIQSNENLGLNTHVDTHQNKAEDYQTRFLESVEGTKPAHDSDSEKAIVLYQPEAHPPESNGSTRHENSKVQLLKVLQTRKAVLQKEQGMAFARAVAAGFEMDHIVHLITFGECFGATRLMEACIKFVQLWKEKHETGQWLEIDSADTISNRSDLSSMIVPGNMVPFEMKKQNDIREVWPESNIHLSNEPGEKSSNDTSAEKRPPLDAQVPPGNQEYFQGQYQHPMFPHWPIHSQPGAPPVFQPYPMHGMPYYQNYPASGPFFPPPYPPMEDPRFNPTQRGGLRRQSMDSKDSNTESESGELGVSNRRSRDASELENEGSQGREPRRKAGRLSKKQAGMVVIRNINYITSKKQNASGSESESASDPDTDIDSEDLQCDAQDRMHKNSRSSEIRAKDSSSTNMYNSNGKDEGVYGKEVDSGNWEAFQKFLLRSDDKDVHSTDHHMFSMEKEARRRKKATGTDPIVPRGQALDEIHDGRMIEFDTNSSKATRLLKSSSEELVASRRDFGGEYGESQVNEHLLELGGRGGFRRVTNDDFMIHRGENHLGLMNSQSDALARNELEHTSDNWDRRSLHNVTDESFVVPLRSGLQDQIGTDRTAPDMDVVFPSGLQNTEDSSSRVRNQVRYEPEDLSLIPERGAERDSMGYDPAMDYEMQVQADEAAKVLNRNLDNAVNDVEEIKEKEIVKDKKLKGQNSLEKRKTEAAARKGKPSKLSPSTEAQARATKLRAYKADLQKMKKEKEEEEIKRLEALKRERQKRIAGRGSSSPAQVQVPSQIKQRLPTKLSPNSHRGSKFIDSEPGSSSPIQRVPIRTTSLRPNESENVTKPSRLNNSGRLAGNGLSRSVSSLPELKKEKDVTTPEPKASTARLRRLSEPKKPSTIHHETSVKLRSTEPMSKSKASNGPEIKKISAIMSLDRTKAATLPELRIRTPKEPSDLILESAAKEVAQKANGTRSTVTCESSKSKKNNGNISHDINGDENPIIEKDVVMLEREIPPIPSTHKSVERMEIREDSYGEDKPGAKSGKVLEYAAIHAPISPQLISELAQNPREFQFNNQPRFPEVETHLAGTELPDVSSISIAGKPYQAPYARESSMEDPSTTTLEYASALKVNMATINMETAIAQESDFRNSSLLEESLESLEKPQGKEPSKGFKRLLKFGRKNSGSTASERSVESDKLNTNGSLSDDHLASSAPYEVNTLKNLISQDETPTASTSQKASRHFSLLSPFRSKTSEKKLTT